MRTRTSLATIKRGLELADTHGVYTAATKIGVHHKTIYRWIARRDTHGPNWPTPDDIAAWELDQTLNGERRARRAVGQSARRKTVYLQRGLILKPAIGTTRRIQALYALGWTCVDMGREVGVSKESIARMMRGDFQLVTPPVLKRVKTVYARLSMTVPTDNQSAQRGLCRIHERARRDAARRGYVPPLAWDDESIDNPAATPDTGAEPKRVNGRGMLAVDVAENVAWLLQHDPSLTTKQLADRLGYADKSGIQIALKRAPGGATLLERLKRNADAA